MRRHHWIIAAIAALAAALIAIPATASAEVTTDGLRYECENSLETEDEVTFTEYRYCISSPRHFPSYKGWAARTDSHCDFHPFNEDTACTAVMMYHDAWQPTSAGWAKTQIGEGTQVYIHPFGTHAGWRWAWTRDSGWVAMQVDDLVLYWRSPTGVVAMA